MLNRKNRQCLRISMPQRLERLKKRCKANFMDNILALLACVRQNHSLSNYSSQLEQKKALQGANYM